MIEIRGPDGGINRFPEGTDDETIKRAMRKQYGGPSPETTGSLPPKAAAEQAAPPSEPAVAPGGFIPAATDIVRSGITGIGQGTLAVGGMLGDIANLVGPYAEQARSAVGNLVGVPSTPEETQARIAERSAAVQPFTTGNLRAKTEAAIGPFYQPKSTVGRYAESVGEFVPSAVTGPGGFVRKAAMAVAPGLLTEGARQAGLGPGAEFAAGILGGGGAAMLRRGGGMAGAMKAAVPDVEKGYEAVANQTRRLYGELRDAGIKYDANAWDQFAAETTHDVRANGFRPAQAPKAHDIIDEMSSMVGKSPDYSDVESLRKSAGRLARESIEPTERAMGKILVRKLDKFAESSPFAFHPGEGGPHGQTGPELLAKMKAAREMASRKIKAEQIMTARDVGQEYVSGEASGLRNQFTTLGRRITKKGGMGFSPEERQAIRQVSQGTAPQRALSTLGATGANLAKSSGRANLVPLAGTGAGAFLGNLVIPGPIGMALGAGAQQAVGMGAKALALRSTKKAAENAIRIMLAGKGAQTAATQARVNDLIRLFASQGVTLDIAGNQPPRSLKFTVGPRQ